MTALLRGILESPLPVIAAIDGHVRAGGLGLVGACDIAVAGPRSTFALTEARIGVAPSIISLTLLPKMSARAAARYYLTGEKFDADAAAEIGLITTAADDVEATVAALVADIGRGFAAGPRRVEGADHGGHAGGIRPRCRTADRGVGPVVRVRRGSRRHAGVPAEATAQLGSPRCRCGPLSCYEGCSLANPSDSPLQSNV